MTIAKFTDFQEMLQAMKDYSQVNPGTKFLVADDPLNGTLGYMTEQGGLYWNIELGYLKGSSLTKELKELLRTSAGRSAIAQLYSS